MRARWKKVLTDIFYERTKLIVVIIAIFFGVFGSSMILDCLSITKREMKLSYQDTNPAAFSIRVADLDEQLLDTLKEQDKLNQIEVREMIRSRIKVGDEWKDLQLYIVEDFEDIRVNKLILNDESAIPDYGEILLEENSMSLAKVNTNDSIIVKLPFHNELNVNAIGSVKDTGLKPAWMEKVIYGYISRDYLQTLGGSNDYPDILFTVKDNLSSDQLSTLATDTRQFIIDQGYTATRTTVFTPGEHPNASSMNAILFLFELFGIISLLLSCILVINLITSVINKHTKQIAVMKSIGATKAQITIMYLGFVAILSGLSTILAVPLATGASRFLVEINSFLLNFTVSSMKIPAYVYIIQVLSGIVLPCLVSLIPIWKVTGRPARENLSSTGLSTDHTYKSNSGTNMKPSILLSLKNTFRRRSRFIYIVATLSGACIMLMTAINLKTSTSYTFDKSIQSKAYDIQFILNKDYTEDEISKIVESNSFTVDAEYLAGGMAFFQYDDNRCSNAFQIAATEQSCEEAALELTNGSWVHEGENEVVINQRLQNDTSLKLGDSIDLVMQGVKAKYIVVGYVREIGSAPFAYVAKDYFISNFNRNGIRVINVSVNSTNMEQINKYRGILEDQFTRNNIDVMSSVTEIETQEKLNNHVVLIASTLIGMSVLAVIVGIMGLWSNISINISERTREIGVLRSIGCGCHQLIKIFAIESMITGCLSWITGFILSIPFTILLGKVFGNIFLETGLDIQFSWNGEFICLAAMLLICIAVSTIIINIQIKTSVKDAIAYE